MGPLHFQDAFLDPSLGEPTIGVNLTDSEGRHGRFASAAAEEDELANEPRAMFRADKRLAFFMGDFMSATACLAETFPPPLLGESCGIWLDRRRGFPIRTGPTLDNRFFRAEPGTLTGATDDTLEAGGGVVSRRLFGVPGPADSGRLPRSASGVDVRWPPARKGL